MNSTIQRQTDWLDAGTILIVVVALFLVIKLHLLPALLVGLLVYESVHLLAPLITVRMLSGGRARILAVALLAVLIVWLVILAVAGVMGVFRGGNLTALVTRLAEIVEGSRDSLPPWLMAYLPDSTEELRAVAVEWLREHAGMLQVAGREIGRGIAHLLIGMIIGALLSLHETVASRDRRPLAAALTLRAVRLSGAFRRVVLAQGWISALNTFFTWLYLGVALPLFGVELPLVKTMIAITFVVGLLPVLGNLISNTVIVIVSLSYSLPIAGASLTFLIVIHKLEYFLNARIVGERIRARAWEILMAMLVMEAAFGLAGLVAAPVYYAYLKEELSAKGLV
jgi:predicted PurR-regulated permease PerM